MFFIYGMLKTENNIDRVSKIPRLLNDALMNNLIIKIT